MGLTSLPNKSPWTLAKADLFAYTSRIIQIMSNLNFTVGFNVPAKPVYDAFIDQQKVMTFTRSPAIVRNEENSEFKMLDGRI